MSSDGRGGAPAGGSSSGCGWSSGVSSASLTVRKPPGALGLGFPLVKWEDAAGGAGVTPTVADELFRSGVDVLSSGNHVWRKKEALDLLKLDHRVLRPADYPSMSPCRPAPL